MFELVVLVAIAMSVVAGVQGRRARRELTVRLEELSRDVPSDPATGLLRRAAYEQRVTGELKRAERFGGTVDVTVWTVVDGDPDAFGRAAANRLHVPEIGFRLGARVFCFVHPDARRPAEHDLVARVRQATAFAQADVGIAAWPGDAAGAGRLLLHAVERLSGEPPRP